jgi:ABC-type multidrug transport system fused ATPase/permease subunit
MSERSSNPYLSPEEGLFSFYWRALIRQNLRPVCLITFLMLVSSLFQMATIGLAVPLLEAVQSGGSTAPSRVLDLFRLTLRRFGFTADNQAVVLSILAFASSVFVLYSASLLVHQYLSAAIAERLRRDTKYALFQRFLHGRYEDALQQGRGAILQELTGPPNDVYTAIIRLSSLFTALFNAATLLIFMLYLSWWTTLLVGVVALFGVYGTRRMLDRRAQEAGRKIYKLHTDESGLAVDSVDGIKIIKAHASEERIGNRFRSLLEAEVEPSLQLAFFRYLPAFINEFAASIIVVLFGFIVLFWTSLGLSFPILVAFLMAIRQCGASIANVNATVVELQSLRRGVGAASEVIHGASTERFGTRSVSHVSDLELDNVFVRYGSKEGILKGVNIVFRKGTVSAIVGPTGAGKTTIAQLITGLISPSSGSVRVGGIDLQELDLQAWRAKIGYVSQDIFLFNATIRDNITLWDNQVPQERIEWAARLAQLHEFVETLPDGYQTPVGDRGLKLSGGQCQRIAIARAILIRPEVLLLDEATSALDNLTEKAVYEAIKVLRSEAIVIAVAHRLSTIRGADQIIVLESGSVVETGTHDSLIIEGGPYSKLFETESVP